MDILNEYLNSTGLFHLTLGNILFFVIGFLFLFVAIVKKLEPYVLLPLGIGIIIANLPYTGLGEFNLTGTIQSSGIFGVIFHYALSYWNLLPPLIFLGLGAMTDFGPIIANPKTLFLGAAAQIGIFLAFWAAKTSGAFTIEEAVAVGIIGGADGPTTIFTSAKLAPHLLGITSVIAYSYMAGVVFIQPPLMKLLTTKKERQIIMKPLRKVSKIEKLLFPVLSMIIIILLVPESAPLISMFMIGNLIKESGAVPRLANSISNELLNIATIFLMITVGVQLSADKVMNSQSLMILGLGLGAFACGTIGGLLLAKLMNLFLKDKINPLIGSAGVSAVPMAARLSHMMAQKENPNNYLLPHALGPNVAGVIGSAVVAGVFITVIS